MTIAPRDNFSKIHGMLYIQHAFPKFVRCIFGLSVCLVSHTSVSYPSYPLPHSYYIYISNLVTWNMRIMNLFLGRSQGSSGNSQNTSQRNQQKTKDNTCRESEERDLDVIDNQTSISGNQGNSTQIEGGGSNLKSTSDGGEEVWGGFNQKRSNKVDQKLLVVSNGAEDTSIF